MKDNQYYEDLLVNIPLGDSIPKNIYQIFIGADIQTVSPKILENIEYIKAVNPEWDYQLFDGNMVKKFIMDHYGERIWHYYNLISPRYRAAQADFFRYLLIYKMGGVYIDIKTSFYSPLDENLLETDKYILYHWDNDPETGRYPHIGFLSELPKDQFPYGEFTQWTIISVSGHPFLRATILRVMRQLDEYSPFKNPTGLAGVLATTGPLVYTLTIASLLKSIDPSMYRHIRRAEDIGIRFSIFDDISRVAHRKIYSTYHNQVTGISRNGSHYWTYILYPYFKWRWVHAVLKDKQRRGQGPYAILQKIFGK